MYSLRAQDFFELVHTSYAMSDSAKSVPDNKSRYRVRKKKPVETNAQILNHASALRNNKMEEMRKRKRDLLKRINYDHTITVLILPLSALIYIIYYSEFLIPDNSSTLWFTIFYFNFTILAFSCGYHKFFTHNAFITSNSLLQYYFAIFGSSIGLGSIKLWASLHRSHHQHTDNTDKDPYLIKRGFYYSHVGWLIKRPKDASFYNELIEQQFSNFDPVMSNEVEVNDDLDEAEVKRIEYNNSVKELIQWQYKLYIPLFLITSLMIPALVTKFMCHDTYLNGLIYPGILRMFLCQQSLVSVESLCHFGEIQITFPTQPFNDTNSSINCNNPLMALITYGQSKQNFHHEFPHDYRNDSSWFSFDPTKWLLFTLSKIGLIEELSTTPADLITQLRIQQKQKVLNKLKSQLNWGTPISKLPLITPQEFKRLMATAAHKDKIYIVILNIIHDITPFMHQHPGGLPLLMASNGKDATSAFFGGVYSHLTAAQNLLATMRIGYLDYGNEEEVWKKIVKEEGDVDDEDRKQESYKSAEAA